MRVTITPPAGDLDRVIDTAAEVGLAEWAEGVLGIARSRVPLDEGILSASGRTGVETTGNTVTGQVAFDAPYAVRQHEDLQARHPGGREARYLATAVDDVDLAGIVAAAVRRELGT